MDSKIGLSKSFCNRIATALLEEMPGTYEMENKVLEVLKATLNNASDKSVITMATAISGRAQLLLKEMVDSRNFIHANGVLKRLAMFEEDLGLFSEQDKKNMLCFLLFDSPDKASALIQSSDGLRELLSVMERDKYLFSAILMSGHHYLASVIDEVWFKNKPVNTSGTMIISREKNEAEFEFSFDSDRVVSIPGVRKYSNSDLSKVYSLLKSKNIRYIPDHGEKIFNAYFGDFVLPWLVSNADKPNYQNHFHEKISYKVPLLKDGKIECPELFMASMHLCKQNPIFFDLMAKIPCFVPESWEGKTGSVFFRKLSEKNPETGRVTLGFVPNEATDQNLNVLVESNIIQSLVPPDELLGVGCPDGYGLALISLEQLQKDFARGDYKDKAVKDAMRYLAGEEGVVGNDVMNIPGYALKHSSIALGMATGRMNPGNRETDWKELFLYFAKGNSIEPVKEVLQGLEDKGSTGYTTALRLAAGQVVDQPLIRFNVESAFLAEKQIDVLFEHNLNLRKVKLVFDRKGKGLLPKTVSLESMSKLIQLDGWPFDTDKIRTPRHALSRLRDVEGRLIAPAEDLHAFLLACGPEMLIPYCKTETELRHMSDIFGSSALREFIDKGEGVTASHQKVVMNDDFSL